MSLFVLPVTAGELEGLQDSIQFFTNSAQATAQAAAINAGSTTVAAYAASLLTANIVDVAGGDGRELPFARPNGDARGPG